MEKDLTIHETNELEEEGKRLLAEMNLPKFPSKIQYTNGLHYREIETLPSGAKIYELESKSLPTEPQLIGLAYIIEGYYESYELIIEKLVADSTEEKNPFWTSLSDFRESYSDYSEQ